MRLTRSVLRSVLVWLLMLVQTHGKRRCNYKEILDSYRAVVFIQLRNLNLTDPPNTAKDRDPCPSGKAGHILVSIYGMSQQILCRRSIELQSGLQNTIESMEQLILHNCSPQYLGKKPSCSTVWKIRGKKRKRRRLVQVLTALITCWQKLQSVYIRTK